MFVEFEVNKVQKYVIIIIIIKYYIFLQAIIYSVQNFRGEQRDSWFGDSEEVGQTAITIACS
jgi:hypothetical protein